VSPAVRVAQCCSILVWLFAGRAAHADEGTRAKRAGELAWDSDWAKFRPSEYVLTGVAGAASLGVYFFVKPPSKPDWTGGILVDDEVRSDLRLHSETARENARTASNVTAVGAVVWAIGVDSILVPALRSRSDIAFQLALMDAESFAVSTLITTTGFSTIGRARPSYADCQRDPNFDRLCRSAVTSSFPSGHVNGSFTAAGVSCAHHLHLAIYGSTLADTLGCVGMIGLATSTSALRVMGDRHYATDVWAGALIGFTVGYGMPTLLHYGKAGSDAQASLVVAPVGTGFPFGPVISGTF
jgi:membrane-associated phospholipid phosphatase